MAFRESRSVGFLVIWKSKNRVKFSRRKTLVAKIEAKVACPSLMEVATKRQNQGPKRLRYSLEVMKALTISAATKLPLN